MKRYQKLLAGITAFALCFSMAGCHVSTPATVGNMGGVEIPSGIYLISQFQAYQTALGYASTAQSGMKAADFLKETVYLAEDGTKAPEPAEGEEQTGEARNVAAFVETETLSNVAYYAAVETLFNQLGGTLTPAQTDAAKGAASQLWENYGDLYQANGIGEATLLAYQTSSVKQNALLQLMYGTDGTEAVSDNALTTFLQDEMVYGTYLSVPLYNSSDFTFATGDQQAEVLAALGDCAKAFGEQMAEAKAEDAQAVFADTLAEHLAPAYDVMGNTFDPATVEGSLVTDLYSYATLETYFDADAMEQLNKLSVGEATAFYADYTSAMIFMRSDPMAQGNTLDDLRDTILNAMMGDTLVTLAEDTGAALENNLDAAAMAKLPASKIVNN